jgi:hypothetical protein
MHAMHRNAQISSSRASSLIVGLLGARSSPVHNCLSTSCSTCDTMARGEEIRIDTVRSRPRRHSHSTAFAKSERRHAACATRETRLTRRFVAECCLIVENLLTMLGGGRPTVVK